MIHYVLEAFRFLTEAQQLQTLQKTFLHFYIAICNESLGLAAHKFSAKKLLFLHLARDAFTAASVSLPLPYASDETGGYEAFRSIPHSLEIDHVGSLDDHESQVSRSSGLDIFPANHLTSDLKQSLHERCDSGYDSESESSPAENSKVPDFNRYSARQPLSTIISHNLSRVKTSSHAEEIKNVNLEEENLIPQPLFIKKRTSDLNKPSAARPLPPPPVHAPALSHRKTATCPPDPNKLNTSPNNPSPTPPSPNLQTHQTSPPSLTTHTTYLTTFHYILSNHLTSINSAITTTTALQHQHHKLTQSKRLASFWSFNPVLTTDGATTDGEDVKMRERKERIEKLRRSGWRVCKEMHGWKGEGFYEELRGRALAEVGG